MPTSSAITAAASVGNMSNRLLSTSQAGVYLARTILRATASQSIRTSSSGLTYSTTVTGTFRKSFLSTVPKSTEQSSRTSTTSSLVSSLARSQIEGSPSTNPVSSWEISSSNTFSRIGQASSTLIFEVSSPAYATTTTSPNTQSMIPESSTITPEPEPAPATISVGSYDKGLTRSSESSISPTIVSPALYQTRTTATLNPPIPATYAMIDSKPAEAHIIRPP